MTEREKAIDILECYYTAFNNRDHETMLGCLSETVAHDINQGGRETGKDAFRAFLQRMERAYAEELADIVVMANEAGTRASAEFIVHGRYLASEEGLPPAHGQAYILPAGAFFEIADDLITRVSVYYNLEQWIAQVSAAR